MKINKQLEEMYDQLKKVEAEMVNLLYCCPKDSSRNHIVDAMKNLSNFRRFCNTKAEKEE